MLKNPLLKTATQVALLSLGGLTFSSLILLQGCAPLIVGGVTATSIAVATDRRTTGTVLDDKAMELKALNALNKQADLWRHSHLSVAAYNSRILLVGQTPNPDYKRQAEEALMTIGRIRHLHNELTIGKPLSLMDRSRDSWITTQVKTSLIAEKNLRSRNIKVLTENNIVYLMGLLTPEEEATAVDIASHIRGVEKVVKLFDRATAD